MKGRLKLFISFLKLLTRVTYLHHYFALFPIRVGTYLNPLENEYYSANHIAACYN